LSAIELCRCCGQPRPPQLRAGVYLPAKKAAIFDTIRNHPGITAEGIVANCFDDDTPVTTVRVHICQINDMLAATRVRIQGERFDGYRITNVALTEAAE
jgi:hypothetical protein